MTERLARARGAAPEADASRSGAAIFVLSIAAIALLLPSAITTDAHVTNDPESQQGYDAIVRHLPPSDDFVNEVVLVRAPGKDVTTDRQVRREVEQLAAALRGDRADGAGPLTTSTTRRTRGLLSPDRTRP